MGFGFLLLAEARGTELIDEFGFGLGGSSDKGADGLLTGAERKGILTYAHLIVLHLQLVVRQEVGRHFLAASDRLNGLQQLSVDEQHVLGELSPDGLCLKELVLCDFFIGTQLFILFLQCRIVPLKSHKTVLLASPTRSRAVTFDLLQNVLLFPKTDQKRLGQGGQLLAQMLIKTCAQCLNPLTSEVIAKGRVFLPWDSARTCGFFMYGRA